MRKYTAMLMLVLALVLAPVPARAAPRAQAVDLVVLIDNSGSMSTNDPSGLRYKVPGLVAKELTGDDRLGVLVFSLAVDRQLPLGAVPTAAEIGRAVSIGRAAGDTDLAAALEAAKKEFSQRGRLEARRAVIFVTDAIPDPKPSSQGDPSFMSRHLRTLSSAAVSLAQDGCRLYGVCLGRPAELGLLEELCHQTGGSARQVTTEGELKAVLAGIIRTEKEVDGDKESPALQTLALQVISPLSGDYPLENQLQLEAAISGGGQRLTAASFEKLPTISCALALAGKETVITLTDDGAGADILADDGLYTGTIALGHSGQYILTFEANGSYQGQKFSLTSRIEDVHVLPARGLNPQPQKDGGLSAAIKELAVAVYPQLKSYLTLLGIVPVAVAFWLRLRRRRQRKESPALSLQTRLNRAAGYHVYYDETKNEPE